MSHQRRDVSVFQEVTLDLPRNLDAPFRIHVPYDGQIHTLDLHLHSVRDGDYHLWLARDRGVLEPTDPGPIVTFRGTVSDDKDAVVAGSLLGSGMQAVVILGDGRHIEIQPDYEACLRGIQDRFIVFDAASATPCCDVTCGVDERYRVGSTAPPPPPGFTPACTGDYCVADIAFDCDFPLFQTFGSSSSLVQDIAEHTLNVANIQYERELRIRHRLTTTIIRTSAGSEPATYGASVDTGTLLTAFQNHWNASQGSIVRDVAHLLTGRFAGGLGYVGVVCSIPGDSYALSSVQFSLIGGNVGLTCYANVLAHELGHNWGGNHCTCAGPAYTMNPTFRPCPLRFDPATSVPEIDGWRDAHPGCLSSSVYNDDCANAVEISTGAYFDSTIGASIDGTQSCNTNGPDVWYYVRPAVNGTLSLNTCTSTSFDTILSIHTGCPGTVANQIACNDDSCGTSGLQSNVSAAVTAGVTYWVRVGGYNGATGTFLLTVTAPVPVAPINDARVAAMDIGPGTYFGNTTSATNDGSSTCGSTGSSNDVWYRYTPYTSEITTLSTFGSLYDTVLTVYDAPGTTELFCNDDAPSGGVQSFIQFSVNGGTTYLVRVSGFGGSAGGFTLDVGGPDSSNTVCTGALPISSGVRIGSFEGVFANEGASSCPHDEEPDLWYRFVAPSAGTLEVRTCGTHDLLGLDAGPDTVVSLHSGCPGSAANQLACNDDNFGTCGTLDTNVIRDSFVSTTVTPGQIVLIRISRYSSFQGRRPFVLRADLRPVNDSCSTALAIGNGTVVGTLVGATSDGAASCGSSVGQEDVWYSYTATCTGTMIASTCGTHDAGGVDNSTDTVLSLHSACPGTAVNELACSDDAYLCGTLDQGVRRDSMVSIPVTPGQVVKIRVAHFPATVLSNFTLRTSCGSSAGYCYGDGVLVGCPCANNAPLGTTGGCLNSLGLDGRLVSSGTTSLAADTLVLNGSNMATVGTCLYFQGTATSGGGFGTLFGDGFRCAAGTVIRLGTKTNSSGASSYPTGVDPRVSVRGLVASVGKRHYQVWYRNSATFCTASTFNLTNGLEVNWLP